MALPSQSSRLGGTKKEASSESRVRSSHKFYCKEIVGLSLEGWAIQLASKGLSLVIFGILLEVLEGGPQGKI